jgi:uncharacterized protein (TIGR03083 family)
VREVTVDQTIQPMDQDQILAAVEAERLRLCAFLGELDQGDWTVPSLCPGWTVRDVVAHLTIPTRATALGVLIGMIRAGGSFHRMTAREARDRAVAFALAELVAQLRETAGSTRRMPGSGPMDPLVDVLVHGQDIARPLGRDHRMPPRLAAAALAYTASNRFFGAPMRFTGLRLVAEDADWSSGQGADEVRGNAENLLMVATGRAAGLAHLSGSGTDRLSGRMAAAAG